MKQYFENLNPIVKEYYKILSPKGIPDFIYDYIQNPEMQRIGKISISCGTDYTKLFNHKFMYSNLEHSIGVALIIWNFTEDKKQTLAGLFHDIATPTFKHCIDFMNGDHEKQESTEKLTTEIIKNSKEIMTLLERDGIKLEEVDDYHIYPIADNDTPRLSADRLEYTFMNGIFFDSEGVLDLKEIKRIYEDIEKLQNEEGIEEIGFKDKSIAEEFINICAKIWPYWVSNKDKVTMQFIADVVKRMYENNEITIKDLYTMSEQEIIEKIENSKDSNIVKSFNKFRNTTQIGESENPVKDKYCVNIKAKKRYNIPLVQTEDGTKRINEISKQADNVIKEYLNSKTKKYVYFDFNF